MNEQERILAKEVGKEACKEFLITLGLDASDPEGQLEAQKDFTFVRDMRLAKKALGMQAQNQIWAKIIDIGFVGAAISAYHYLSKGGL